MHETERNEQKEEIEQPKQTTANAQQLNKTKNRSLRPCHAQWVWTPLADTHIYIKNGNNPKNKTIKFQTKPEHQQKHNN